MKYSKTSKKLLNLKLIFVLLGAAVIILAILEITGVTNFRHKSTAKVTPPNGLTEEQTKQQAAQDLSNKKKSVEQSSDTTPPVTENKVEVYAQQESNATVTVFTKLYGYTSGNCTLKITNGTRSTTKQAEIIFQAEYSSCAGFSIPISELGNGVWNITLSGTANQGSFNKTITFEVK